MSAYIVEDDLIDALVSHAKSRSEYLSCVKNLNQDEIGQILLDENYRSVNYRYRETETAPKYAFRLYTRPISSVQIIKACNCYDYQCCETDDYETTKAAKIVNAIRENALRNLPGYDDAEWGVPTNPNRKHLAVA